MDSVVFKRHPAGVSLLLETDGDFYAPDRYEMT